MANGAHKSFAACTESQPGRIGPNDPSRRWFLAAAGAVGVAALCPIDASAQTTQGYISGYLLTDGVEVSYQDALAISNLPFVVVYYNAVQGRSDDRSIRSMAEAMRERGYSVIALRVDEESSRHLDDNHTVILANSRMIDYRFSTSHTPSIRAELTANILAFHREEIGDSGESVTLAIERREVPPMGAEIESLARAQAISRGTSERGLVVIVHAPEFGRRHRPAIGLVRDLEDRCSVLRYQCTELQSGQAAVFVDGRRLEGLDGSPEGIFSIEDAIYGLENKIREFVERVEATGRTMTPGPAPTAYFYNPPE